MLGAQSGWPGQASACVKMIQLGGHDEPSQTRAWRANSLTFLASTRATCCSSPACIISERSTSLARQMQTRRSRLLLSLALPVALANPKLMNNRERDSVVIHDDLAASRPIVLQAEGLLIDQSPSMQIEMSLFAISQSVRLVVCLFTDW